MIHDDHSRRAEPTATSTMRGTGRVFRGEREKSFEEKAYHADMSGKSESQLQKSGCGEKSKFHEFYV